MMRSMTSAWASRPRRSVRDVIAAVLVKNLFIKMIALKRLTYAEKEIEMAQALAFELAGQLSCLIDDALEIVCRIQIVPEVEAQRADGCLVTQSQADRVRCVVVTAVVELRNATVVLRQPGRSDVGKTGRGYELHALGRIGLVPASKALDHIVTGGEYVAHIVEDGEAESLSKIGQ